MTTSSPLQHHQPVGDTFPDTDIVPYKTKVSTAVSLTVKPALATARVPTVIAYNMAKRIGLAMRPRLRFIILLLIS